MTRNVKKGIILVFSWLCLIGLTGCHWFSSEKQKTQLRTTEETIEAVKQVELFKVLKVTVKLVH